MEFLTKMRLKFKKELLEKEDQSLYITVEEERRKQEEIMKIRKQIMEEVSRL